MKRVTRFAALAFATTLTFTACKKDVKETAAPEEIGASTLSQIKSMGFGTNGVQRVSGGYLVEGDIFLPQSDLGLQPSSPNMIIAQEEQYRTFNLVNPSTYPTIKVSLNNSSSAHQAAFSAALDNAIARYNAQGLRIKFQRVTSGANTTVTAYYEASNTLGFAGFPTSNGAPYNQVQMNTYHYSTSTSSTNVNYIATIIAHELGHCIGFRHTDYMNRAYSCGTGGNEGQSTSGVGAVHIPGTPTGPSSASWMLACVGNGVNRPFNSSDRTALAYVY
ncbi:MAG TPA: M57 family metalloprotease [Flavisolibacter sp.]|nr:M57 family metalloprotease [Flavisolibacter sp.]